MALLLPVLDATPDKPPPAFVLLLTQLEDCALLVVPEEAPIALLLALLLLTDEDEVLFCCCVDEVVDVVFVDAGEGAGDDPHTEGEGVDVSVLSVPVPMLAPRTFCKV